MATSYTSLLGLALPVTGELAGTWGDTVNNSITSLLDSAVAGTTTLSNDADVTLTTTTGATNQSRQAILLCSGVRTVLRTITAPAQSKMYVVINNTTGGFGVVIRGVGPTTGVTVAAGKTAVVVWNGTDFVEVAPATATTATNLAGGVAGSLPYQSAASTTTFLGIGAANYVLTSTGTAPTWTINTGTGSVVRATSPTLVTPTLGVATATSINKVALTAPATGSTLTIADGKTLTASNTLTFTGTDSSSVAFGTGGTVTYTSNNLSVFAATTSAQLAGVISDETGTGTLVFNTSPTLTTPAITGGTINNAIIGGTTRAAGNFTTLDANGNVILGDASTDTLTVNGYVSIGGTPISSQGLRVIPAALTGTTQFGSVLSITATSAATAGVEAVRAQAGTAVAAFTTAYAAGLWVRDALLGAGSTITNNYGVYVDDKTVGTNNYGVISAVSSGANKYNIYASGTADNYFAGDVGIGTTTPTSTLSVTGSANVTGNVILGDATTDTVTVNGYMGVGGAPNTAMKLAVLGSGMTGANQYGINVSPQASSAATSTVRSVSSTVVTEAAVFTCTNAYAFLANDASKGAGSSITNLYGLYIADQTQGTNNYGIASLVSSGANKYNIYASGTADNYFAGNVLIGATAAINSSKLLVAGVTGNAPAVIQGSATNSASLAFYNNAATTNRFIIGQGRITGSDNIASLQNDANAPMVFGTNALERMRIDAAGNVLIGATAAINSSKLLVAGVNGSNPAVIQGSAAASGALAFYNNAATTNRFLIGQGYITGSDNIAFIENDANAALVLATNSAERMRIDAIGDVGIGTTAPDNIGTNYTTLDIRGSAGGGFRFGVSGSVNAVLYSSATESYLATTSAIPIIISTNNTERMRIDSAGNVGIGLTNPVYLLQIGGTASPVLGIKSSTDTGQSTVAFGDNTANGVGSLVYDHTSNYLAVTVNAAERMRIDSAGNVGVGVTPSAWKTVAGTKALQIGVGGALFSQDSSGTYWTVLTSNSFQNTSNVDAYINTGFATSYTQTAGKHIWSIAPSGTAGSALTFTGAMLLDTSGNLGVGTTTPVNKLQINGSLGRNAPVTKAASFTLAATENWLICNGAATITVTLPAASSWTGREVMIKNIAAFTVVSASSNVVPLVGGAAGTAILAATAGKFATLVSDGTNWIIMQGN